MDSSIEDGKNSKFPYSGQLEVEIYFKEYRDSCANDCRRYLHKGRNDETPLIRKLRARLSKEEDIFTIFPKDYALLRHVPLGIDVELESGSKRSGSGKARGGLEIYDVSGLSERVLQALKGVLENERKEASEKKLPWFNYYRIYLREEV